MADFVSPDSHYADLDQAHPYTILQWASETIDRLAIATSFQASGLVLLHLLKDLRPDIPVLFLNTGFHFPETLAFRDRIVDEWNLKLVELTGAHGANPQLQAAQYGEELFLRDPDKCCFINKVAPLQVALEEYDAWISGLRRDQSPLRSETPVLEAQLLPSGNEVIKIHPLARWTRDDVKGYISMHDIPTHPLLERGFASIGCQPCTRALRDGETERAGRWEGFNKTECGIHSFGKTHETEAEQ